MSNKFKTGDTVKVIDATGTHLVEGSTHKIANVIDSGSFMIVGHPNWFYNSRFLKIDLEPNGFNIKVEQGPNPLSKAIQTILFDHGFVWWNGKKDEHCHPVDGYICVNLVTRKLTDDGRFFDQSFDIKNNLSEIIDLISRPVFVEVKLNDKHTAKVYVDKVVVGCQEFPISVIESLVSAKNKLGK